MTPIDIREYRIYLLAVKNHKSATVNRKLASLSAFGDWAREAELIPSSPIEEISQVEQRRPVPKWLDKNDEYGLLRAFQEKAKERDIALITLMLNTGLRVSEVANLGVSDVEISPGEGSLTVQGRKGEKFRRVALNVDARNAVQDYLEEQPGVDESDRLLMGQRGEPLQPPGIYYLVERYAYDARLEEVTPHTLRHTFGKNMVDAGTSLDRVASLLGHESVDTTRIYTTPSEQDLQREVEKVAIL